MPITWLIFHDFDMNIVILVQRNQIKGKVVLKKSKYQIDGFAKKCSTSTIGGIFKETNNFL